MHLTAQTAAAWGLAMPLAMLLPATALPKPPEPPSANVRLTDPTAAETVRRMLRLAADRLARPECQRIFSDFRDAEGRPLKEKLDAEGVTGQSYLGLLLLHDGSAHPRCRTNQIYAVARPGSRTVLICSAKFAKLALRRPRMAQAVLIHEALHALGLGENPPSSTEITFRVSARCGL